MAEEETRENESPDMKWDAESMKIIEEYAKLDEESADLTDRRSKLRKKAEEKLGISSHDLQESVYQLKKLTKAESKASQAMQRKLVRANEGRQQELWSEEYIRNEKRAAEKRRREAEALAAASGETPEQQERRLAADTNPRSDPKRGGAGKGRKKKPAALPPVVDDQRAAEIQGQQNDPDEQAEGEAVLSAMTPETTAAKESQSALAQKKLEEAKLA